MATVPRKPNLTLGMLLVSVLMLLAVLFSAYKLLSGSAADRAGWGWLLFVGLVVLAISAVMTTTRLDDGWSLPWSGTVIPAFVACASVVPGIAAVSAIAAYLSKLGAAPDHWTQWVSDFSVLIGIVAALCAWPLFALVSRRFTRAKSSSPRNYNELMERITLLRTQVEHLSKLDNLQLAQQLACHEADAQCKGIEECLQSDGLSWVTFTGYIDLWNRVHRAEEALIQVLPIECVVSGALYDEWCLKGSTIENRDDLLTKLRFARKVLSQSKCFDDMLPAQPPQALPSGVALTAQQEASAKVARQQQQALHDHQRCLRDTERKEQETELRAILRQVRRSRNEFRDGSREGLMRARNRLFKTGVVTGLAGFVLLSLALSMDAGPGAIIATVAFYLVGAIVGLFNRLLGEADSEQAIDDYGLTTARLIHTPLFSGLAAVGGVVLIAMLPVLLNPQVISPRLSEPETATTTALTTTPDDVTPGASPSAAEATPSASPVPVPAADQSVSAIQLGDVFDLEKYPFGIIVAAIFGLTPSLLVSRLQSQTDKYKLDLKSTQASERQTISA